MDKDEIVDDKNGPRRHASKWSLVVGLVILVAVAMSCRNNGDGDSASRASAVVGGRAATAVG